MIKKVVKGFTYSVVAGYGLSLLIATIPMYYVMSGDIGWMVFTFILFIIVSTPFLLSTLFMVVLLEVFLPSRPILSFFILFLICGAAFLEMQYRLYGFDLGRLRILSMPVVDINLIAFVIMFCSCSVFYLFIFRDFKNLPIIKSHLGG